MTSSTVPSTRSAEGPSTRPGVRCLQALWILAGLGLLVPMVPVLAPMLGTILVVLVALFVAEARWLRGVVLRGERAQTEVLSLDEVDALKLKLTSTARRPLEMEIRQLWPSLLTPRSSTLSAVVRPGEVLDVQFDVRAVVRGKQALARPWASITLWGLAERLLPVQTSEEEASDDAHEVRVLPNLKAVRRLDRELNRFFLLGLGSRASARFGKGREFERLREYRLGDDFRDLAWKASAHHGKLIVQEYRLDRSQDILLCVDHGHRMAARVAHLTRLDHAVNAAMLLSYISNRMEDRVGLLSFAADVDQGLAQGRGSSHLRQLTAYGTDLAPQYLHTDYQALAVHLRRRLRQRTLVLILTSLPAVRDQSPLVRAVSLLMPKHLPLVIVLGDPVLAASAQVAPTDHDELCRTLVARDVWGAHQRTIRQLRQKGALVVETPPHQAGIDAVNAYIEVKRRQML